MKLFDMDLLGMDDEELMSSRDELERAFAKKSRPVISGIVSENIPGSFKESLEISFLCEGSKGVAMLDKRLFDKDLVLRRSGTYSAEISNARTKKIITDIDDYSECDGSETIQLLKECIDTDCPKSAEDRLLSLLNPGLKLEMTFHAKVTGMYNEHSGVSYSILLRDGRKMYCRSIIDKDGFVGHLSLAKGESYRISGFLTSDGFFISSAVRKMLLEGKGHGTMTVSGAITLVTDPDKMSGDTTVMLGGYSDLVVISIPEGTETLLPLREGGYFRFTCAADGNRLRALSCECTAIPDNHRRRGVCWAVDEILFSRRCRNKEPDSTQIDLMVTGIISETCNTEYGMSFKLEAKDKVYTCIYDSSLCVVQSDISVKEGLNCAIRGILADGKLYVGSCLPEGHPEFPEPKYSPSAAAVAFDEANYAELPGYMETIINGKLHKRIDTEKVSVKHSESMLLRKYEALKEYYPECIQKAVQTFRADKIPKAEQRTMLLDYLVNTPWDTKLTIDADYAALKEKLDKQFYRQDMLKDEITNIILSYKYKKSGSGTTLLLTGPPGVGKTSMIRFAAEAAGIPFYKLSFNGVNTPSLIKGTPRLYDNALPGLITRTIHELGNRCIILIDEVDKSTESKNDGDPISALYELLDTDELFRDAFVETGVDISDVLFVLTANDTSALPEPLINRTIEVFVSDYSDEEKVIIARDYIIPSETHRFDFGDCSIEWDSHAIYDTAVRFTLTSGVRDIRKNVDRILCSLLRYLNGNAKTITIDSERVRRILCPSKFGINDIRHDISGLKSKYLYFKPYYHEHTRKAVAGLFEKYYGSHDKQTKEMIRKRLDILINIVPAAPRRRNVRRAGRMLDTTHYGMEDAKKRILTILAAMNAAQDKRAGCILLDGPCGVGKTSICRTVASALGLKFAKVSLNGISSPEAINGFEGTWSGAEPGSIMKALMKAGTDGVVILLDEIDKLSDKNGRDPSSALLDLLDGEALFTDRFLDVGFDMSNVLFIATSNDISKIPAALRDRMEIVSLSGYGLREKAMIGESYILRKLANRYGLSRSIIPGALMELIVNSYCRSNGVRDLENALDRILCECLRIKELTGSIPTVNKKLISEVLGESPTRRGNVSRSGAAGLARALAVSGNSGTTFAVQAAENSFGTHTEITGLPRQSILDSVKIASLLLSRIMGKKLPPMHIHFGEGGVEKDGPSAGITIFAAMYSCLTGHPISPDIGMTGEIDIFGDIWPVGGVEQKLTAAANEGCKTVFIPYGNYLAMNNSARDVYGLNIVPIKNVSAVCRQLFGGLSRNLS